MLSDFANRIKQPTPQEKLNIFSDGNDDYSVVLAELFDTQHMNYGQLIKVRKGGRVVDKIKKVVYGSPTLEDIDTVYVENYNGIIRGQVSRTVRKTKCFGKRLTRFERALCLYQFYRNFMYSIDGKVSPAILEGLDTKIWTWGKFLHAKLRYSN